VLVHEELLLSGRDGGGAAASPMRRNPQILAAKLSDTFPMSTVAPRGALPEGSAAPAAGFFLTTTSDIKGSFK
jgi:hypothetical protein